MANYVSSANVRALAPFTPAGPRDGIGHFERDFCATRPNVSWFNLAKMLGRNETDLRRMFDPHWSETARARPPALTLVKSSGKPKGAKSAWAHEQAPQVLSLLEALAARECVSLEDTLVAMYGWACWPKEKTALNRVSIARAVLRAQGFMLFGDKNTGWKLRNSAARATLRDLLTETPALNSNTMEQRA